MHKGHTRKQWSKSEEITLKEYAGKMPLADLSKKLGRSSDSIKQKVRSLNAQGASLSLRYSKPRVTICPTCGQMRSRISHDGLCKPCRLKKTIERVNAETSKAIQQLSVEQKRIYSTYDARLKSKVDPFPTLPVLPKGNTRRSQHAKEEYYLACEQIEIRNLNRVLKARRRRYERICEKFVKKEN